MHPLRFSNELRFFTDTPFSCLVLFIRLPKEVEKHQLQLRRRSRYVTPLFSNQIHNSASPSSIVGVIFLFRTIFFLVKLNVLFTFHSFSGEGNEPVVREASEAVRDRRGIASEEGPDPIREVAKDRPNPEEEEDPQAEVEGPTNFEPVH